MKASELPDKIYVDTPNHDFWYRTKDSNSVEYVRTDAFIEKACEYWYKYNRDVVTKQCCGFTVNVEDFRKYMREE